MFVYFKNVYTTLFSFLVLVCTIVLMVACSDTGNEESSIVTVVQPAIGLDKSVSAEKAKPTGLPSRAAPISDQTPAMEKLVKDGQTIEFIYSANLNGELEPCGCTAETDYGGIARRASVLDLLKSSNKELVFVSGGGLLDSHSVVQKIKNQYILRGFKELYYDVIGVQWSDLAFGSSLLKQANLPLVSSNMPDSEFVAQKNIKRGKTSWAFFSILDPESFALMGKEAIFAQKTASLKKAIQDAYDEGQYVYVLTDATPAWVKANLPLKKISVLQLKAESEFFEPPTRWGDTLVLTPGKRGMRLGVLRLIVAKSTQPQEQKILTLEHDQIELENTIIESGRFASWYAQYNNEVKQYYEGLNEFKKDSRLKQPLYVGDTEKNCQGCHSSSHTIWEASDHAAAFATLAKKGKAFDPECLACHTVRFHQPGGFIDTEVSPNLVNVQCESCHEGAYLHSRNPLKHKMRKMKEIESDFSQFCVGCHNKTHSPKFDYETYWPRIKHGSEK